MFTKVRSSLGDGEQGSACSMQLRWAGVVVAILRQVGLTRPVTRMMLNSVGGELGLRRRLLARVARW